MKMTSSPVTLQDLQRWMYLTAKAEPARRFGGLYGHVCEMETLRKSYALAKANKGIPGIDDLTFKDIKAAGTEEFLAQIRHELVTKTYEPLRNLQKPIPKAGGKVRMLSIPAIRDRVVQGALRQVLEPIFEADFQPGSFGYRPGRSTHAAINRIATAIGEGKTHVTHLDLRTFFDRVRHHLLLQLIAKRVDDDDVMRLLKQMLVVNGKMGVPQGGVISPLLSNIYLTGVDWMLEQLKKDTCHGQYTAIETVRFADDIAILVDGHPRHAGLIQTVNDRVRHELAKLDVEVNEDKTRLVDLEKEERFEFLGFEFCRIRSHRGRWRPHYTPTEKKQAEVRRNLMAVVERAQGQSLQKIVKKKINPIVRGWVNYFAIGHSDRCFDQLRAFLEQIVRQQAWCCNEMQTHQLLTKHQQREWMYGVLQLFNRYQTRYYVPPAGGTAEDLMFLR